MRGYAGKFLEIDLETEKVKDVKFGESVLRQYIGGRGLATKILWDRLGAKWDTVDSLGPENLLLVLTGPMTGYFPGSRVCVSGKSPQSNGIVGSTIAGEFGVELKCSGYDGIILTGVASKPSYLLVVDSHIELRDAKHIWGLEAKEALKALVAEGREKVKELKPGQGELKEPSVLYIGPAGERKVRIASVMAKWTHAAGYGGYGAVMGSKNLKALVVKGTGPLPKVADFNAVKKLIEKVCRDCYENDGFRRWGTAFVGYDVGYRLSAEPIRNWQEEWHDEKTFGVDRFEERVWVKRYWGDFGCPTTCIKIAMPKVGPFKGVIGDNPDYELQAYLGTNLGIFSPEDSVYLAARIDELGMCGINAGNVLGFAAELYQRGLLTKEDLDGIELKWGDVEAFEALARKISSREGIGNQLAEGSYRAALQLAETKGREVLRYAVHSKGIAIGAHGVRSGLDYPSKFSYACSVQGGDHTSIAQLPLDHDNSELTLMLADSGVFCWFNTFSLTRGVTWKFLRAVTGWKITRREWYEEIALRILDIQRAMLLLGGPDLRWTPLTDDDNPPRFYEPLPSGPKSGKKVTMTKLKEMRREYFDAVGWDENGIPRSERLRSLGLADVERVLKTKLKM